MSKLQVFSAGAAPIAHLSYNWIWMFLERQNLLDFDAFISQLLTLKDSDFSKFLNSDQKTVIKPFVNCLLAFIPVQEVDEIILGLHEKILKFLLRLCPSFNAKLPKKGNGKEDTNLVLRSVICPKKFMETLFESDPLGILVYLYTLWNPSEYLDIIRDELVPSTLIKSLSKRSCNDDQKVRDFLKWITKNTFNGTLNNTEKESILRRFEYESDDDYFEDEDELSDTSIQTKTIDPIQAILLSTYVSSPSTFSRTLETRKSAERLNLLKSTNLAHEQVEGWALMLERNPKKSNIIQDFIIWHKNQQEK